MGQHSSRNGVLMEEAQEYDIEIDRWSEDVLISEDNVSFIFQPERIVVIYRENSLH